MPENEDLSSLERVRQRLYDPAADTHIEVPHLREQPVAKPTGWDRIRETVEVEEKQHLSGPARFFIIALVFFVLTAAGAGAYLLYGGRSVSTNNVSIATQGPTTTASGDTVPILVRIENKNPVPIHETTITITFPDGTKSPTDPTTALPSYVETVGDIPAGGSVERTVRATVFGSEGQLVALPVHIEYHTDGSSSTFVKDKQYQFTITTSPITLTISSLAQVSSGQPVTVDVLVRSNATTPLDNVAVNAVYPFGFTPTAATPTPSTGSLFVLGTLAPGEEKRISVTGVVSGQNNDDRVFSFTAGTLSSASANQLATSYTSKETDIKLTKPFLDTTVSINHDTSDGPVIDSSASSQATISWTNTLASPITNGQVTVVLSGNGLDPASVQVANGFYRSSDTTVLFDAGTNQGLKNLQPSDTGQGIITFSTKKGSALASLRQPTITLNISVAGQRIGESNVPEVVHSSLTRVIKVGTNLALVTRALRTIGPIANTGPWPPQANKETTYTIQFGLTNTVNSVAGAKVVATLPEYVRFTGKTSPSDGSLTYNETTRTVTWSAGDIPAGTATPKTMSFQVALLPSVTQQGTSPVLVSSQEVTGVDRFTGRSIDGTVREVTTQTTTDPGYTIGSGEVK